MPDVHANAAALQVAAADILVKANELHNALEAAVLLAAAVAVQAGTIETREVASRAEEIHAEHHPGTFVPSLDSCTEHTRGEYEALVRDLMKPGAS